TPAAAARSMRASTPSARPLTIAETTSREPNTPACCRIRVRENRSASGFGMRWGVRVRVAPCAGAARRDTAMCRSMTGHRRPTCGLTWTTVPVRRTLTSGGRAMTDAPRVRVPVGARLRGTFADPVLRSLTIATLISTVGRGVALTLVVLYLSLIARLPAEQVALVFAVGSGIGVAASYFGGHLADTISARALLVGGVVLAGLALASYAFVTEFWAAIVAEALISIALGTNGSVRSAIIARAFDAESRVTNRAVLRTVTNIGISVGTGVGALARALGTPEAYRVILVVGGLAYASSAVLLLRLPSSVDAPRRAPGDDADAEAAPEVGRSPWRDPRYLAFSIFAAVFAIQFVVLNIGIPLWVAHDTTAPEYLVSIMFIVNTVLVIALQVPLSRGTHDLRRAGNVTAVAGVLMAL